MPVVDGQAVSAAVTNPAFLDAQVDDTALGIISLHNTDTESGAFVENVQRSINRLFTAAGVDENTLDGTTYNAPSGTIDNGDDHETALYKLAAKFDTATGHSHNPSIEGDGGPLFIQPATTGEQGVVYLSDTDPLDITGSPFKGTAGGYVANADHTHRGVRSLSISGDTDLFNDIDLVPSGAVLLERSGQEIRVFAPTGSSGGGGGAALIFRMPDSNGPVETSIGYTPVLAFWYQDENEVYAGVTVPAGYVPGTQILVEGLKVQSPVGSGNVLFEFETALIRDGNSDLAAPANVHTSTNTELTLTTPDEILDLGDVDLTDSVGEINSVAIQPGDHLAIKCVRKTSSETSPAADDANLLRFSGVPKFS